MIRPTPEQLAILSPTERRWLWLAELWAGPLKRLSEIICTTYGTWFLWFCGGRRIRLHGLEHMADLDRSTSLVMVANHRSFFDFYVITYACNRHTKLTPRYFFPVRATFFYERAIGALINLLVTGMAMFPPIMRERDKGVFNRYALARMAAELRRGGTMIGIHPEGKRNQDPDPYTLLPAQPGVGHIAAQVEGLRITPVFIKGMTNDVLGEIKLNWTRPEDAPIDVCFGPPVAYEDLVDPADPAGTAKAIADRCMEAVARLGEAQRLRDRGAQPAEDVLGASRLRANRSPEAAPARRVRASAS